MSHYLIYEKIRNLFIKIISIDKLIDNIRLKIPFTEDNVHLIFKTLDNHNNNYISLNDLESFFKLNNITCNSEILNRIINCYDINNNLTINYDGFLHLLQPRYTQTNNDNKIKITKKEINNIIISLFKQEVFLYETLIEEVNDIKKTKDFTTYESFISFAKENNYINKEQLMNILDIKNIIEVEWLLQRLNKKGRMTYEQFKQIFFPFQNDITGIATNLLYQHKEYNDEDIYNPKMKIDDKYFSNEIIKCVDIYELPPSEKQFQYNRDELFYDKEDDEDEDDNEEEEDQEDNIYNPIINETNINTNMTYEYNSKQTNINNIDNQNTQGLSCKENQFYQKLPFYNNNHHPNLAAFPGLKRTEISILSNLLDYITKLISLELTSENLKESLSLKPEITFPELFSLFDISKTNTITVSDFLTTCKSFAVFPSINEVKVLYKRYAISLFDQLNYPEFIKMISPIKSEYTKIIENRNVIQLEMNDYSLMLFETKTLIKDMLNHFLYCETFLEKYRKELNTKNEFSCIEAWAILMRYSQSGEYITKEEFKQFLDDKSCLITKFELDCLINKFDWDKDGVVNYSDFAKEILTYGK